MCCVKMRLFLSVSLCLNFTIFCPFVRLILLPSALFSNPDSMLFLLPVTMVELDFWCLNCEWPKSCSPFTSTLHPILLSPRLIYRRVSDWNHITPDSNPELTPASQKTYSIVMITLTWAQGWGLSQLHLEVHLLLSVLASCQCSDFVYDRPFKMSADHT